MMIISAKKVTLIFLLISMSTPVHAFLFFKKNDLRGISVEASADVNDYHPVAVDLVFIKGKEIAPTLFSLSGPDWFKQKKSLLYRYPKDIRTVSLEVVPSTAKYNVTLPKLHRRKFHHVILFANYITPSGQYPAELSVFKQLNIQLKATEYILKEEVIK